MADYAHPQALVTTDWVADHVTDPKVKLIEVDVDTAAYDKGHIPGAIGWNWQTDLNDKVQRDIIDPRAFAELNRQAGIQPDDVVIFYGDNNNWFAAWAFWQLKIYGHRDVRLLDGGRKKWLQEGETVTTDVPVFAVTNYRAQDADFSIRAFLPDVQRALLTHNADLVDVRSPQEFTGEILAPPGLPETAQRGGHIPGARSIPWGKAANEDGTFKSFDEIKALYAAEGIDGDKLVIAYCRIGERSSYSWFVLKYLLGYQGVVNYDGSWTEWGNLVGAPIERGAAAAPVEAVGAHAG